VIGVTWKQYWWVGSVVERSGFDQVDRELGLSRRKRNAVTQPSVASVVNPYTIP
jgi:hypothetical protein